jgi:hypothetical protein
MRKRRDPRPEWMNAPALVCIDMSSDPDRMFVEKYGLVLHDTAQGPMTGMTAEQYDELSQARYAEEAA